MSRRLAIIGVLAASLLAACSSSSSSNGASSAEGKKYVNAMVAGFNKDKAKDPSNPLTASQAKCLSQKMVDTLGVDTLKKAGVTPTNLDSSSGLDNMGKKLTPAQAAKVADVFFGGSCFDMANLLAKQFDQSFKDQPKGASECLANEVVKLSAFKQAMTKSILGDESASPFAGSGVNELLPAFTKCHIDVSKLGG